MTAFRRIATLAAALVGITATLVVTATTALALVPYDPPVVSVHSPAATVPAVSRTSHAGLALPLLIAVLALVVLTVAVVLLIRHRRNSVTGVPAAGTY